MDIDQVHVAQQSRRDKLRVLIHHKYSNNHLGSGGVLLPLNNNNNNYNNNESSSHLIRNYCSSTSSRSPAAGNICYDPSQFPPELLDKQQTTHDHEQPISSSFINFSPPLPCNPQQPFNTWKSIGGSTSNDNYHQASGPTFNMSASSLHVIKSNYLPYQDQLNSPNLTNSNTQSTNYSIYQNTLQDLVTSSNVQSLGMEKGTQALSLSLSSVPSPKVHATQVYEGGNVCDPSHGHQDMTRNLDFARRNHGPLGPFTGYATILKSSKYLIPAQQIMDQLCSVAPRPRNVELREVSNEFLSGYTDREHGGGAGGTGSSTDSYRPENLQKKAKLLYMQDEVCKRYKQYHQQMQMVLSSFESVAGLSTATPYISLALKTISKHFTCLKNAITDQVKGITNAFGENLSLPTQKSDNTMSNSSMIKFFDQTFQKQQKGNAPNLGILQEGQHVWRPQRGLPERAVSILRAWLFDHFLHPYPTDTDKHMLASQTGLTRNQVSNWFINARVRVWKPMVEEIHMLETKGGAAGASLDISKTNGNDSCAVDYQEKRSRIEYHMPSSMEGSLMGGLGAVSLTLGLRQSAEGGLQQEQHHMRRQHLGGCWLAD